MVSNVRRGWSRSVTCDVHMVTMSFTLYNLNFAFFMATLLTRGFYINAFYTFNKERKSGDYLRHPKSSSMISRLVYITAVYSVHIE